MYLQCTLYISVYTCTLTLSFYWFLLTFYCCPKALLANISAMYAVYHGPEGIKEIAEHVHNSTLRLAEGMCAMVNSCVYECTSY